MIFEWCWILIQVSQQNAIFSLMCLPLFRNQTECTTNWLLSSLHWRTTKHWLNWTSHRMVLETLHSQLFVLHFEKTRPSLHSSTSFFLLLSLCSVPYFCRNFSPFQIQFLFFYSLNETYNLNDEFFWGLVY